MGRSLLEGAGNTSMQKSGVGLGRNEEREREKEGGEGREREEGERGGGRKETQGGKRQRPRVLKSQVVVCCLWLNETEIKFKCLQN